MSKKFRSILEGDDPLGMYLLRRLMNRKERTLENRIMSILTEMRHKELYGRASFDEWWKCACRIAEECLNERREEA